MLKSLSNLKVVASYMELAGGISDETWKEMKPNEKLDYCRKHPGSRFAKKQINYKKANYNEKKDKIGENHYMRAGLSKMGNPRWVVHYEELLSDKEEKDLDILDQKAYALQKAKKFGGKPYNGKDFGGGILFEYYGDIHELVKDIRDNEL